MQNIVIIGGGASGLVAAIAAAKKGKKVLLLEKNNICGKKILVTGNGRCNYFNEEQDIIHYRSKNKEKLEKVITKSNTDKVLNFFTKLGIEPKIKNGYYYPFSNQATSIQNALISELKNLKVEVKNNIDVQKIIKEDNYFKIITDKETFLAEKIILATGSKASSKTGSDGIGYKICKELGHTIIKPLPALVQLKGNEKYFKDWNGIRADILIELYENNEKIAEEIGEIQLTDYGISGICVMNLSGRVARGLNENKNEKVKINFLNGLNIYTKEQCYEFINKRNNLLTNRTIIELLEGILNYKLINVLLKKSNINNKKTWNDLSEIEKELLVSNIIELEIDIFDTNSFDKSQVCSGGIALDEMNIDTMESNIINGLYIVGELLDVDGDCGGYNLTWAWLSGIIAGENI